MPTIPALNLSFPNAARAIGQAEEINYAAKLSQMRDLELEGMRQDIASRNAVTGLKAAAAGGDQNAARQLRYADPQYAGQLQELEAGDRQAKIDQMEWMARAGAAVAQQPDLYPQVRERLVSMFPEMERDLPPMPRTEAEVPAFRRALRGWVETSVGLGQALGDELERKTDRVSVGGRWHLIDKDTGDLIKDLGPVTQAPQQPQQLSPRERAFEKLSPEDQRRALLGESGAGGAVEYKSSDANSIRSGVANAYGGMYDPVTEEFKGLDKAAARKATRAARLAEEIYRESAGQVGHNAAVDEALNRMGETSVEAEEALPNDPNKIRRYLQGLVPGQ